MVSREDAESNARLMGALFGSAEEAADAAEHDQSVSSHLKVHRDEDGDLVQLRFVYVDEVDKITNGASGGATAMRGGWNTRGVQNNFLKLLEETEVSTQSPMAAAMAGGFFCMY